MGSEAAPDLVFVHLSDIHFRQGRTGDAHDLDEEVRNELEIDLRAVQSKLLGRIDGIIVTGDIAFAGKADEFKVAASWLTRVRELVDCPTNGVLVTPGNHDVDRDLITDPVRDLHRKIRDCVPARRDEVVSAILRDAGSSDLLLKGLGAYNEFAAEFSCSISAGNPFWEKDFPLKEGSVLRIRGITTALISGPDDHEITHRMAYGGAQRRFLRRDGVFHAVVGHHPPSWCLDGEEAERAFQLRSSFQLFGHKHDQWLTRMGRSVRLIAGAVHPERNETNWEPRYSLLAITLRPDGLHIRMYPRRWSREESTFIPDFNGEGHDYRDHFIPTDG